jgi:hypothetical protein
LGRLHPEHEIDELQQLLVALFLYYLTGASP